MPRRQRLQQQHLQQRLQRFRQRMNRQNFLLNPLPAGPTEQQFLERRTSTQGQIKQFHSQNPALKLGRELLLFRKMTHKTKLASAKRRLTRILVRRQFEENRDFSDGFRLTMPWLLYSGSLMVGRS